MVTSRALMRRVAIPAAPAAGPLLVLPQRVRVEVWGFQVLRTGTPPRQATRATLTWEPTGLEVVFCCEDEDVVAEQRGPGNVKLWKDDSVYLWLEPGHTHAGDQSQVMVQVNAAGEFVVMAGGRVATEAAGVSCRAECRPGGWRALIRVSWPGLVTAGPQPGDVWGFNLTRMDQPGTYDYARMEQSSLAPLPGGELAAADAWGHLLFATAAADGTPDAQQVAAGEAALAQRHARRIDALGAWYYRELLRCQQQGAEVDAARGWPADPQATEAAYQILRYLAGLPERRDRRFLLAQDIWSYEGRLDGGFARFVAKLAEQTGKWLPLLHVSYGDVTPPGVPGSVIEEANRHAQAYWRAGGLVTIHLNPPNPWVGGMKLDQREKLPNVIQPGTPENLAWTSTLDLLAAALAQLRDAGVVVLWRPLHEMTFTNCYWYDSGACADPEVFKDLWRYMFRYLTYHHQLHNLLWVYSVADVGGWNGPAADAVYPGGDYVDIVGISLYGNAVEIGGDAYERLLALGKPFAFSEFGPGHAGGTTADQAGAPPAFDNLNLLRAVREKYPQTIYANYWHSWPGAAMALIDNPNAGQLMDDPWIVDRAALDWRRVSIPDLAARRARRLPHKEFEYPSPAANAPGGERHS